MYSTLYVVLTKHIRKHIPWNKAEFLQSKLCKENLKKKRGRQYRGFHKIESYEPSGNNEVEIGSYERPERSTFFTIKREKYRTKSLPKDTMNSTNSINCSLCHWN